MAKILCLFSDMNFIKSFLYPHVFSAGRFGEKGKRDTPLSPKKYFNQMLLEYTQKFASDSDYIFFTHFVLQNSQLNEKINITMQKSTS